MKRFLRRAILGFVPTLVAALVLGVPTAAPVATGDLQDVSLACNDGTNLGLTLSPTAVLDLSDAITAINLYPAGDPALSCSLSQSMAANSSTSSSAAANADSNGPKDMAVGGGRAAILCATDNFGLSVHAPAAPSGTPVPTSGGTFNVTTAPNTCPPFSGHLVSKPDCLEVGGNGPGSAQLTAIVTKSTGVFATFIFPGDRIQVDVLDSGLPGGAGDSISVISFGFAPCDFGSGYSPTQALQNGNIHVKDR